MARHYVSPRNDQITPTDLAAIMADPAKAAELFGGGQAAWRDFETRYAAASPVVDQLAGERAQLQLQEILQAGGGKPPKGLAGPQGRKTGRFYDKRAPGTAVEGVLPESEYPMADFFRMASTRFDDLQPLRTQFHAAMSERVPAEGGFLVPELMRSDILELALEQSVIRPRARIVPMDSLRVPYPALDDVTHANAASVYGGVSAFWTEEAAALTASAPAFARIVLEAQKLTAFTSIPNELLQDSGPLLEDWLKTSWPAAVAWYEDDAFINGDGVGIPQGFLNAPAAIKVATASAYTITLLDIIKAYCRMLPQALPGAVWMAAPDVKQQLLQLSLTPQTSTSSPQPVAPPAWFTSGQAIEGEPDTLFGHPVFWSEKMPSGASSNTTTAGALSLCNFSYYLLGERAQMQLAMSQEYHFASDLTDYRLIERCTGRVWPQSALTPRNGGATLSPFVLVDTTS